MITSGLLRAVGDAKRSMYVMLLGAVLTAALDPIFIFVFGLEVTGAAIVSALVRVLFGLTGLLLLLTKHDLLELPDFRRIIDDTKKLGVIGGPAMFTNLAAPVGAFLIAEKIAEYGDEVLAGQAVVDRFLPLAFGVIFALSSAVGPIVGQNFGAGRMDRVKRAFIDGITFNIIYVSIVWLLLFSGRHAIADLYSATDEMALMINLFCTFVAGSFLFNGLLFIANATFNNLGKPLWATSLNWARQTIGVIPFILIGDALGGIHGIAIGWALGPIPFALLALYLAFKLIRESGADASELAKMTAAPATR